MRPAEATSSDVSTRVTPEQAFMSRAVSEEGSQQFASVLQSTRQSSQFLMQMLSPQQAQQAERGRDRKSESRSRLQREEANQSRSTAKGTDKSSRTDRTRATDRARGRTDKSAGSERDADQSRSRSTSANSAQQQNPPGDETTAASGTGKGSGLDASNATASAETVGVGGAVTEPAAVTSAAESGSLAASGAQVTATDPGQAAALQQAEAAQGLGNFAVTPAASSAASGEAAGEGQTNLATAGNPGAAATGGAANSASAAGESDFKQLLSQLDRSRPVEGDAARTGGAAAKDAAEKTGETVDLDSPGSVAVLARIVRSQIGSRRSLMTLDLSPAELGRVRVDVRMQDSAVSLRFATETAVGQQEIKSRLSDLKHALEQQGVTVDRVSVEMLHSGSHPSSPHDPTGQPQPDAQRWDSPTGDGSQSGGGSGSMPDSRQGG